MIESLAETVLAKIGGQDRTGYSEEVCEYLNSERFLRDNQDLFLKSFRRISQTPCGENVDLSGDPLHDAIVVSKLRNLRLDATHDSYGVDRLIYHYIVRTDGAIQIFEEPMDYIDIDRIRIIKSSPKSIRFAD